MAISKGRTSRPPIKSQAVDRRIDRHAGLVENGAACGVDAGNADKVEPLPPALPVVDVQQRKSAQIRGRAQPVAAVEKLRTADREQLLRAEPSHVQAGIGSVAVAYGEIDVLAREVDVMERRADPKIDFRMRLGKTAQPMDEPLRGEIRRGAHGERAAALALQQAFGSIADAVESVAHDREIGAACLGDDQPLAFAIEQLQPELGLERLDLMADGALGDAQFLGRAREALVPGRGFESLERVERRQAARHGTTEIMRKTTAG